MINKKAVIIFIRAPKSGEIKTRLAASLGNLIALEFYSACVEKITGQIRQLDDLEKYIFYSGEIVQTELESWLGSDFIFVSQSGKDLGERIENAFNLVFSENAEAAVILGSDIPDLNTGHLNEAFSKLSFCDAVIGPSIDGGYYLLGIKKLHCDLFTGIKWSSDTVLKSTVSKLKSAGLNYHLLEKLCDIDNGTDLKHWLDEEGNIEFKSKIKSLIKGRQHELL